MKIFVVGMVSLEGGASASRMFGFACGLASASCSVELIGLGDLDGGDLEEMHGIRSHGIRTRRAISTGNDARKAGVLVRLGRRIEVQGRWSEMLRLVEQLVRKERPAAILFYNQDARYFQDLLRLCKREGICLVQQYAERKRWLDYRAKMFEPAYWQQELHLRRAPRESCGNVVISRLLARVCEKRTGREALIIPALCPSVRRINPSGVELGREQVLDVGYLGLGERRDEPSKMLAAVREWVADGTKARLWLAGVHARRLHRLRKLSEAMGLSQHVRIDGYLSDAELGEFFRVCGAFMILRTQDQSSQACFPTRLPEFLETGKPVILSDVGDFGLYLRDRESAMLVRNGAPWDVSERVGALARDRELRVAIGKGGRTAAQTHFGIEKNGAKLREYISSLSASAV